MPMIRLQQFATDLGRLSVIFATLLLCGTLTWAAAPAPVTGGLVNPSPICTSSSPLCGGSGNLAFAPFVVSVSPSVSGYVDAYSGGEITIKGSVSFAGATAVFVGAHSVPFTAQPDGTISATAPGGDVGSTVGVSVVLNGQLLPSSSTFSYPIGEMDVMGPLPYTDGVVGDPAWNNGREHPGYVQNLLSPASGALTVGTSNPPLHIVTSFYDNSVSAKPSYTPPNMVVGNLGLFSAQLQECRVANGVTGEACTNWDGNQGAWVDTPSASASTVVPSGGPATAAFHDLALPISGLGLGPDNIVKTIRYQAILNQGDAVLGAISGPVVASGSSRSSIDRSNAFNVVANPTALVQMGAVPYTIVYQPPGDQSTASFQTMTTYGTKYSFANSNEVDNDFTADQSGQFGGGFNLAWMLGLSINGTNSWDTTTKQSFGKVQTSTGTGGQTATQASQWVNSVDYQTIPGSGLTCAKPTSCAGTKAAPDDMFQREPFWEDTFVLLVHQQLATWVLGNNQPDRWVMYGAVPAFVDMTVGQLDACARGYKPFGVDQCAQNYSTQTVTAADGTSYTGIQGSVTLTPGEAQNLLALDPFYAGGQHANLPTDRAVPIASPAYGGAIGLAPEEYDHPFSNVDATETGAQAQTSTTLATTSMIGYTNSVGVTANISTGASKSGIPAAGVNDYVTVQGGVKDTTGDTIKTTSRIQPRSRPSLPHRSPSS